MKSEISALLLAIHLIYCSPFDITEQYIAGYKDGIENFTKEASEHKSSERHFHEEFKGVEPVVDPNEYDFIIVGGGTSGAVLASRLSEIPEYKILLLEAGGDETKITKIPSMTETVKRSKYSWGYQAKPDATWCLEAKQCHVDVGKVLGGTSSINDMIYARGNPRDYDLWADHGNDGWCYDDVLPYFKKSENAHLEHFDRKYHNQGGLLNVENPSHITKLTNAFLDAGKELGYAPADYNGKDQIGFNVPQLNTKEGERYSTSEAYMKHFPDRKNIVVSPESQAVEILISPHTKEAKGVKYVQGNHVKIAKATKEVILAAGAINSAQLLILSGVGPKELLESHHIEVKQDAPVGKYLKDHPTFIGLNYNYTNDEGQSDEKENLVNYLRYGKGPLTSNGVSGLAYLKTKASKDTANYPDVYMTLNSHGHEGNFDVHITAAHPKSEGEVTLKSHDPLNWPEIYLNHLSDKDEHDVETLLQGIRFAQHICDTNAFKKLETKLNDSPIEACKEHEFNSDDYWRCAIKQKTVSAGHYTGTCAMGHDEEKSVVDHNLRVRGIHKLRVADASVIPVSITGHTQAASIMIAEKAADLIKHDWK